MKELTELKGAALFSFSVPSGLSVIPAVSLWITERIKGLGSLSR